MCDDMAPSAALPGSTATGPLPYVTTQSGFDALYRAEYTSMVALARAICGDHNHAEDLAQEAFSRAHRHWSKVSGYDRPGAWVRRVTINLALSRRRRMQRELTMWARSAGAGPEPDASDWGDPAERTGGPDDEVWLAVSRLSPRQRAVVALFYQQDLSTAEIANALGCSVSTATSHLNQARTRLATMLNEPIEPSSTEVDRDMERGGHR